MNIQPCLLILPHPTNIVANLPGLYSPGTSGTALDLMVLSWMKKTVCLFALLGHLLLQEASVVQFVQRLTPAAELILVQRNLIFMKWVWPVPDSS